MPPTIRLTWGVISDIDDTIIQTQTSSFCRLLMHTFLSHPEDIEGMPQLFAYITEVLANCQFWYISATPYNLLPYFRSPPNITAYSLGEIILPCKEHSV